MPVVRTVVTSLPRTTSAESSTHESTAEQDMAGNRNPAAKTYRIDPGPSASLAKPAAALGATVVGVDVAQLLADLEAESRRLIGPSAPPPRG